MRVSAVFLSMVLASVLLSSCAYLPQWMGGKTEQSAAAPVASEGAKKASSPEATPVDVLLGAVGLEADPAVADQSVIVPDPVAIGEWRDRNRAMRTQHLLFSGLSEEQSATLGEGSDFTGTIAPVPVVAEGRVFAMDGTGVVSAHDAENIDTIRWTSDAAITEDADDVLGGGIAVSDGVVFVATGYGKLVALDSKTGKKKWKINVGAPVRGAPAIAEQEGMVVVLTADNQTLAFSAEKGEPRWAHRGIRESAGYYSATSPVVEQGLVITCYSSGEVFALRAETGDVVWTDTLTNTVRTSAAAMFSGIDADPIVQEGVVVTTSASSEMQASLLANGRPLWQARVGSHSTPWSAGNVLYVLSSQHQLAALFKRNGAVRWVADLGTYDDQGKDTTPTLYGPILAGDALLVIASDGTLRSFHPETGEKLGEFEIAEEVMSPPVVVDGALYLVTREGRLYRYSGPVATPEDAPEPEQEDAAPAPEEALPIFHPSFEDEEIDREALDALMGKGD